MAAAAIVCVLGLMTMGADSCSTETKNTADPNGGGGGGHPKRARLGDSITLEGNDSKIKVTVLGVTDPLSVGSFDEPSQRNSRFLGVEIELRNVGSTTYSDSPSNGAKIVTDTHEQADPTIVSEGDCSGGFAYDAIVSPGSILKGCIPFEVKNGQLPKTFQFSLDSGFGPQSGEWRLG
jgi:hypothetical protein